LIGGTVVKAKYKVVKKTKSKYDKAFYLSGAISFADDFEKRMFYSVQLALCSRGYTNVYNPLEMDKQLKVNTKLCVEGGSQRGKVLLKDVEWIIKNNATIVCLPSHTKSSGSKLEQAVGVAMQLPIIYLDKNGNLPSTLD
jgi:hypothetical protein